MNALSSKVWPVAIIGGGVVGCAILREFTLAGTSAILLERGRDILSGASKGNSAILHTGFDANPESLEFECMQIGRSEFLRIRKELNLPMLETSAILAARNSAQLEKVSKIHYETELKGFNNVEIWN